MHKKEAQVLFVCELLNLLLMIGIFMLFWFNRFSDDRLNSILAILVFTFLYFQLGKTYEIFEIGRQTVGETVYSQVLTLICTEFIMFFIIWIINRKAPAFSVILSTFLVQILASCLWAWAAHEVYKKEIPKKKTVIIKGRIKWSRKER